MNEENQKTGEDLIREKLEKELGKARNDGIAIGAKVMCRVILDKITAFERTPGTKSNNDHKRLIKSIKQHVETGLYGSANSKTEDEVSQVETVQN